MYIYQSLCWFGFTSIICACGPTTPPAMTPAAQHSDTAAIPAAKPKQDESPERGFIRVSEDVRRACGLANDEAYFAFDSAHVRNQDRLLLKKLADCFVSGPLIGHPMNLVGHADPRGSADYNLALAGRRADNVKQLLVDEAMDGDRVSTTSRGEMDAMGTDEKSWAKDRSVEVKLGS